MVKVLFTHSYFLHLDPKQWKQQQPYPPLGTIWAASLLRENNYNVALFDTMLSREAEEVLPYLEKEAPKYLVIYDDGFNYLTKMCLTNMREAAWQMARLAKAHGCTVIVNSSDSTDHTKEYLDHSVDFVIRGEGEISLLELVNCLENNGKVEDVAGISFTRENTVFHTSRREVLKDLDTLPPPAWDLVDLDAYAKVWKKSSGFFSLNMATTRGCPYKCNWCAKPIYGNRYNNRSPKAVVQEIKLLRTLTDFDHIWFCDDIFGLQPKWVNEFALEMASEGLRIPFKIQSRADLLLRDNAINALKLAGCTEVWIGAESGSQKILDAMDKGISVEEIAEACNALWSAGINPAFFLQFGYPGETKEDIEATIQMVLKLKPYQVGVSVSYPLPGTVFFERVKSQLGNKTNWTDSDELLVMFKNEFPPEYYKILQRYVHHLLRKEHLSGFSRSFYQAVSYKNVKNFAFRCYYTLVSYFENRQLQKFYGK